MVLAAKNNDRENLIHEAADYLYHLLVLLAEKEVTPREVMDELEKRKK